ncbi:MAG TPA: hypothetical protein VIH57_00180, partial [Bacteroidales bacterium]
GIDTRSVTDFYVDWGDGTNEKVTSSDNHYGFTKRNKFGGDRLVQIWGNLPDIWKLIFGGSRYDGTGFYKADIGNASKLEELYLTYTCPKFSLEKLASLKLIQYYFSIGPVNIENCTNLEVIRFIQSSPDTLDIRTNNKLKSLVFDGKTVIIFGKNPSFNEIHLADYYPLTMTVEQLNKLFIGLLASVESSPRAGTIKDLDIDIKPTGEGLQAAQKLKNTYHWTYDFNIE